ncbi:hypothetical protein VMT65_18325 [Nocardia sp. CDC153]|uniref:DUF7373 family lipoprotein n=1 Tax=Nocardia sp. CDC153 TaxID=3112167 RepID=UPI002DBF1DC7|nr:hypothetical protein [Nocardia sp. CDC153]MEC3955004.1 hypothetical protein [Nocardia sp. CDC153]
MKLAHRATGRTVFGAFTLGLAAAFAVGCGTQVSGTAVAGEADVRTFAVGNYPTEPLDVRATPFYGANDGKAFALARLADNVVVGTDVDAKFGHNALSLALLDTVTTKYSMVLAGAVQPALVSNGMMFGFSAAASTHELGKSGDWELSGNFNPFAGASGNPDATSFNVTVLQFPDQQRAQAAADQMEAADFAVAADQNVRVTLDQQPDAKAHWRPGVPSLAATAAHGQYVVNVYVAQPKPDLDGLRALATQIFAAQLPLLDQAPALSPREIFRMKYDPDAMLRRTLHPYEYPQPDPIVEVTHAPRGYLHSVADQPTWQSLLTDNGVDRVSTARKGGLLLRARDPQSATALWSGINRIIPSSAEPPAGVPNVACVENPKPKTGNSFDAYDAWNASDKYLCTLHYDRYVARVASSQLADAQQKAAAQYALLANSQYL